MGWPRGCFVSTRRALLRGARARDGKNGKLTKAMSQQQRHAQQKFLDKVLVENDLFIPISFQNAFCGDSMASFVARGCHTLGDFVMLSMDTHRP